MYVSICFRRKEHFFSKSLHNIKLFNVYIYIYMKKKIKKNNELKLTENGCSRLE